MWAIKNNNYQEVIDFFNEHGAQAPYSIGSRVYFHFPSFISVGGLCTTATEIKEGYREISYEEFLEMTNPSIKLEERNVSASMSDLEAEGRRLPTDWGIRGCIELVEYLKTQDTHWDGDFYNLFYYTDNNGNWLATNERRTPITLEQYLNRSDMKNTYENLKKWCIKDTPETKEFFEDYNHGGYTCRGNAYLHYPNINNVCYFTEKQEGYTKVNLKQFEILKKISGKDFYIVWDCRETCEIANKFFDCDYSYHFGGVTTSNGFYRVSKQNAQGIELSVEELKTLMNNRNADNESKEFKVGDLVLVKADKSSDSYNFDGQIMKIKSIQDTYVEVEGGSSGLHYHEITKVEDSTTETSVTDKYTLQQLIDEPRLLLYLDSKEEFDKINDLSPRPIFRSGSGFMGKHLYNLSNRDYSSSSNLNFLAGYSPNSIILTVKNIEEWDLVEAILKPKKWYRKDEDTIFYLKEDGSLVEYGDRVRFLDSKKFYRELAPLTPKKVLKGLHDYLINRGLNRQDVKSYKDLKITPDLKLVIKESKLELLDILEGEVSNLILLRRHSLPQPYKGLLEGYFKNTFTWGFGDKDVERIFDCNIKEGRTFWHRVIEGDYPIYNKKVKELPEDVKEGDIHSIGWNYYSGREITNSSINYVKSKYDKEVDDNWINSNTLLSKSLSQRISKVSCNEEIKEYILSMEYSLDINFCSYSKEKEEITYCPKGKQQRYNGLTWEMDARQSISPYKFFGKILQGKFAEYDIKCFADELVAVDGYEVRWYAGSDIPRLYREIDTDGWSQSSCMSGNSLDFFQVYLNDAFRLGVIYEADTVVGRFLEVTCQDGFKFCDRAYYKSEHVWAWYKSFIDKEGLTRKMHNCYEYKREFYNKEEGEFTRRVIVDISSSPQEMGYMPYMDTLTYGDRNGYEISNYDNYDMEFNDTEGHIGEQYYCPIREEYYDRDEMVEVGLGVYEGELVHENECSWNSRNNCYIVD